VEFLSFGKYTAYVWSSTILTYIVLIANVIAARRRLRSRIERARRQMAVEEVQ
jgi:heme exporter protein D